MASATEVAAVSARLIQLARSRGRTLAVAESLTGGAVAAALVAQPGASAVLTAGIVAYTNEMKTALLGVDATLLAERGSVDADVAVAMADGVRRATGADLGLATTGVAGPEPHDGKAVGTVYLAVCGPGDAVPTVEELALTGHRDEIRQQSTHDVLALALAGLERVDGAAHARPGAAPRHADGEQSGRHGRYRRQ